MLKDESLILGDESKEGMDLTMSHKQHLVEFTLTGHRSNDWLVQREINLKAVD